MHVPLRSINALRINGAATCWISNLFVDWFLPHWIVEWLWSSRSNQSHLTAGFCGTSNQSHVKTLSALLVGLIKD